MLEIKVLLSTAIIDMFSLRDRQKERERRRKREGRNKAEKERRRRNRPYSNPEALIA